MNIVVVCSAFPLQRSLMSNVVIPESEALAKDTKKKVLVVAVTSDRGLCGGVNSSIARYSREQLKALKDAGHDVSVRVLTLTLMQSACADAMAWKALCAAVVLRSAHCTVAARCWAR